VHGALHIFVLVHSTPGIAATDFSKSLVLVTVRLLVLHMLHVDVRHLLDVLHQVQFSRQELKFVLEILTTAMPARTRPIEKFAQAIAKCSAEVSVYGKCIVADYNSVHKDKCLAEFLRLKDCYVAASKRT